MKAGYVKLLEKEEMWARMLLEVLEDNGIPCVSIPVYGAGLTIRSGAQEWLQIYVPWEFLPQAEELVQELFSAAPIPEEKEQEIL